MSRYEELCEIFKGIDQNEQILIQPLIHEVVYLEERMEELKKMPQIQVSQKDPQKQRMTAAAKQYKECSQSYMNAVRILLNTLRKAESSAADELMKRLEEFA